MRAGLEVVAPAVWQQSFVKDAEKELVVCLAEFVVNLEKTKNLHMEDPKRKGAFQQVIIAMRRDLGVVDETTKEAKQAIRELVRTSETAHSSGVEATA